MKARGKFALWVAVLFAAGLAVPLATGVAVVAVLPAADREVVTRVFGERMPLIVFGAMALLALAAMLVRWFFGAYVAAATALAELTRAARAARGAAPVASEGAAELVLLAREIERIAGDLRRLGVDADARVRESLADLEEERNRLAALMSELVEGVLVCNAEGRVLLYNEQARALLSGAEGSDAAPVGLGRSVFSLIDREQVAHAIEKLEQARRRGEDAPRTRFVAPAVSGRLVKFEAAPYRGASDELAGIVFTLGDVTGLLEREAQRLAVLQSIATQARAPVANIRAAAENLARYPDMAAERQRQFVAIIGDESLALSRSIQGALRAYGEALKASLVLQDMRALDLARVAEGRVRSLGEVDLTLEPIDESLWLTVDSFSFVQALCFLAARLKDDYGLQRFSLSARAAGRRFVELDLGWRGVVVSSDALTQWELEPLSIGGQASPLTLRDVLERHGGELWMQRYGPAGERDACFRFLLPAGEPVGAAGRPKTAVESRPEFYDFDLFAHAGASQDLRARALGELAYTVFDMETTGLAPSAGDEIISIGAVRIVNGRLLKSEIFERLVDPQRPLNPDSAKVHGIDARMLEGQPRIEEVLPGFHKFCEDTVLVAHNAAFDMRFLELKEKVARLRFEHPVLDTLLMSAVAQPGLGDHRLEAIAERLGIPVIGRHTALGDALLTGEIFLRLLALLRERGITTLGEALDASRETYYARLRY